jgi:flagellar export protein FliJ
MNRFAWRLQRLLDLKVKQQDMLRAELMALSEQLAQLRARVMLHKAEIHGRLAELRELPADERPARQHLFLQFVQVLDDRIRRLEGAAAGLEEQREQKMKALLEIRQGQKSLEKLRERAKTLYHQQLQAAEQKETDETTSRIYARKILLPLSD